MRQPIQAQAENPSHSAQNALAPRRLVDPIGPRNRTHLVIIHPLAAVSPAAEIHPDVEIGPFSVIEPQVTIAAGCRIASHVVIRAGVTLGRNNQIFEGAILGGLPQHTNMPERPGRLKIGDGNVIRENVTIHRALTEEGVTSIGSRCLLMVNSHVAHDCHLGDEVILTNNVMLAGHVEISSRAYLAGAVAVHQFCRVGRLAMVGGLARVRQDVPPFVTIDGGTTMVVGLNRVGLRRAGFRQEEIQQLQQAYQTIYRSGLAWDEMIARLQSTYVDGPAAEFARFFLTGRRGFVQERRTPPGATVRIVRKDDEEPAQGIQRRAG